MLSVAPVPVDLPVPVCLDLSARRPIAVPSASVIRSVPHTWHALTKNAKILVPALAVRTRSAGLSVMRRIVSASRVM